MARNFLGRGQDLRISTVLSFRSQQVDLSFTEPYFLDKNIAAGIDLPEDMDDNFDLASKPLDRVVNGLRRMTVRD